MYSSLGTIEWVNSNCILLIKKLKMLCKWSLNVGVQHSKWQWCNSISKLRHANVKIISAKEWTKLEDVETLNTSAMRWLTWLGWTQQCSACLAFRCMKLERMFVKDTRSLLLILTNVWNGIPNMLLSLGWNSCVLVVNLTRWLSWGVQT